MTLKTLFIGGLAALSLAACSQAALQTANQNFARNLTAADCSTPAAEASFIANLPPIPLNPLNGAQMTFALSQLCVGLYGSTAAPATAAGNVAAIPAAVVAPATK